MKKIYILTTYTGTILSTIIKKVTHVPYAHVSLGLDEYLTEVYSFGRKYVSNPIFAGFVREYIDDGLYKKMKNTNCRVYYVEVTDSQYEIMLESLNNFIQNKRKYKYDTLALVRLLKNNAKGNEYKYVCSQFVAYILEECGLKIFNKPSNLITPMDFYISESLTLEYEGLLSEYRIYLNDKNLNKKVVC